MPREKPADPVDLLVAQLRAAAPEFSSDRIREIAMKLRAELGGRHHYFRKADLLAAHEAATKRD